MKITITILIISLTILGCLSKTPIISTITKQAAISCWEGTFLSYPSNTCTNCTIGCQTCVNSTVQGCSKFYFQPTNCPEGQYISAVNNQCADCAKDCKVCSGPSEQECTQHYYIPAKVTCYEGQYVDSVLNACDQCSFGCKVCAGPAEDQCSERFFIPTDCYEGNFLSSTEYCDKCSFMCNVCTGPLQTDCKKFYPEGSCDYDGYWQNKALPDLPPFGQCQRCLSSMCQTCVGPNKIDCTLYYPTDPAYNCGAAYFMNVQHACQRCILFNSQCLKCNGTTFEDCTVFTPLPCNPVGQFFDNAKDVCGACIPGCKTCNGYTNSACSVCLAGFIKNLDGSCKQCAYNCNTCSSLSSCQICDKGFFTDSTGQCQACYTKCDKCQDSTWAGCLTFQKGVLTDLQTVMKQAAQVFYFEVQPAVNSLVDNFQISGKSTFETCNVPDLQANMNANGLPIEVQGKLQAIAFMQSTQFQGFSFKVNQGQVTETQYVGSARSNAGVVQYALVQATATGTLVQQYQQDCENVKSCHTCWHFWSGFRCCHTNRECHQIAIGYSGAQLIAIQNQIEAQTNTYIMNKLQNPPASFQQLQDLPPATTLSLSDLHLSFDIRNSWNVQQPPVDPIQELLVDLSQWITDLNSTVEQSNSTVLKTIQGEGYSSFYQTTVIQKSMGVYDKFQKQFINLILGQLNVPQSGQATLQSMIQSVVNDNSGKWTAFSIMFNPQANGNGDNGAGDCQYVCLLGRNNQASQKTDWVQVQIGASFELAPDYFVVRNCDYSNSTTTGEEDETCRMNYIQKNRQVTPSDSKAVFDYFELIAFQKIQSSLSFEGSLQIEQK